MSQQIREAVAQVPPSRAFRLAERSAKEEELLHLELQLVRQEAPHLFLASHLNAN